MITAPLYLWLAAHGQLPFDPWWVVGFGIVDAAIWSEITSFVHGDSNGFINLSFGSTNDSQS